MLHLSTAERRARLVVRHRLAPTARAATLSDAADAVLGLHASDPVSVFLAARARMAAPDPAAPDPTVLERALYEERSVLRMHGVRRTLFVVPVGTAPEMHAAAATALATAERRRLVGWLAGAGIAQDPDRWLDRVMVETLAALAARGEASTAQLTDDVSGLRERLPFGEGKPYAGVIGVGSRVLYLLALEGRILRGRPLGTWVSSQYRWLPIEAVIPGGYPDRSVADARAAIVRRWLRAFGPGTLRDLRWWTGWAASEIRRSLAALEAVEIELDEGIGWGLPDDLAATAPLEPVAVLLPSLDPTVMGWADRGFYLGGHGAMLFDRAGNAGPTIWWDGRVVGGWTQRRSGRIAVALLEDIGSEGAAAVDAEAERLAGWLGPVRITPRYRVPLDRELAG